MGIAEKIVIFVISWWMVFFIVLPWGVRSQVENEEVEPGTEPGAPSKPMLVKKALVTTVIAFFVSLAVSYYISKNMI